MILITRMKGISKVQADQKFAIVRRYKYPVQDVEQLAALSPSEELFYMYRDWESAGVWDSRTFEKLYAPRFISEIAHSAAAIAAIKYLKYASSTESIVLACYCQDEALCHRWIIGSLLQGLGMKVKFADGSVPRADWFKAWKQECLRILE